MSREAHPAAAAWRAALPAVRAAAEAAWPRECAGLVAPVGTPLPQAAVPLRTAPATATTTAAATQEDVVVHTWPAEADRFEVPAAVLLALHRLPPAERARCVLFHSHPRGGAELSAADRAGLAPLGVPATEHHGVVSVPGGRAADAILHRLGTGGWVRAADA